ncbi:MAG: tRNA (guanosine(37)-N1)-methyltransferase TrmD [Gammaproteobacteria bacterium]|nr:tRNA (guanosine(37)-N1)-methyltransferase TrmD [Gammaproteobacteria bacterium]
MRIALVTLFPELVRSAVAHGVLGRALQRGLASVECVDPRQWATDAHRTVDDRPYGGGPGMVGTPGPWAAAIDSVATAGLPRIHLSAQGEKFDQAMARQFAAGPGLVLVASRYEGLDQAVVRLLPGALGDERSSEEESFTAGRLDWPHYTRPVEWEGRKVPTVLQGGNHALIRRWRLKQSIGRTWLRRPELLQSSGSGRALSAEDNALLQEYLAEREVEDNG